APEAVGLAFGAFTAARGDFRTAVLTAVNMGRDADTTAAVAGSLAGALHGESAIPPDWANAIGPVRGSCLPSMRGYHVLDIAELLTPDDPEAGATRERGGGREPSAVRDMASVAASFEPGREERR
ncbi:ADP-ribosylglycohydrolase family protein, partial [Streptomyces globisporus]